MTRKSLTPKGKQKILVAGIFAAIFLTGVFMFAFTPIDVQKTYNQFVTTTDGVPICFDVFEPANNPATNKPAVILGHGIMVNKEMMRLVALELAKNGFVAVPFDFRGHGQSGGDLELSMSGFGGMNGTTPPGLVNDILAIKQYLKGRGDINMTNLGYLGYSMGGGAGFELLSHDNDFNAMVGMAPMPDYSDTNVSNPRNLLIVIGGLDETNSMNSLWKVMANKTGLPASSLELGHLYGSFVSGTAAKMVVDPLTDHLTAPYDPNFVREIVNWYLQALQGVSTTPADFAYPVLVAAAFIAMAGALGLFWTASGPILDRFARKKQETPVSSAILGVTSNRNLVGRYLAYGLVLSVPCMFAGAFLLATPLTFSAFFFMFLAGPSVAALLMVWRTYAKQGIGFAQMYRTNVATTSGRNLLVGTALGVILYALLLLSANNLLGIVPSIFRWGWLPLYYVAIVFALINFMVFALPLVAEKFGRGRKFGIVIAAAINILLSTVIFGVMMVIVCLAMGSFFFIIILPPTFAILFITFCTGTYYYLRTNDVIMPSMTAAIFWTLVIVTLSPFF
ncbi:MAG TPA: alpha/beta hydrolase [Candidatus Lokiarchaeia archaeon]|nr:alpha/beta hydrolase [Candidatus Lokiarchaeia archaeon]